MHSLVHAPTLVDHPVQRCCSHPSSRKVPPVCDVGGVVGETDSSWAPRLPEAGEPDLSMSSCMAQPPCNLIPDRVGCLRGGLGFGRCAVSSPTFFLPWNTQPLEDSEGLSREFIPPVAPWQETPWSYHRQRRLAFLFHLLLPDDKDLWSYLRASRMAANRAPSRREDWGTVLCIIITNAGVHGVAGEALADGCHGAMWLVVVEPVPSWRLGPGPAVCS